MSTNDQLNDQRAQVTRSAIRDALLDILRTEHPAAVSIPAVAKRAGVSVRTVYRYFPTKQLLLDHASEWHVEQAAGTDYQAGIGRLTADTASFLPVMWRQFADNIESVRAQHMSPVGQDIRARRRQELANQTRKLVETKHPNASNDDIEKLTDLTMSLTSSSTFLELVDRSGREPEQAAEMAWWAVTALHEQFATDGFRDADGFGDNA